MTHRRTNPTAFIFVHELRHAPTDAEQRLWLRVRNGQVADIAFRRQHAIGPYIVDICAPRIKLIIEVDESQHMDQAVYDAERTQFLEEKGYRVLRFWNNQIIDLLDEVIMAISTAAMPKRLS
jgi:very-short-patch-repair endonuclease